MYLRARCALAIGCQIYCNKVFPKWNLVVGRAWKLYTKVLLILCFAIVTFMSLRARCALAIGCQIYCNKVFPK